MNSSGVGSGDPRWLIADTVGQSPAGGVKGPDAAASADIAQTEMALADATQAMQQFWKGAAALSPVSVPLIAGSSDNIDIFDLPALKDLPAPMRYFAVCAEQMKSESHWKYGSGPGSETHWKYGSGPGSETHWKYGSGPGSETHWKYGSGPQSESHWKYGSGVGSESFWKYGSGPGSESFWKYGSGPGSESYWKYGGA